MELRQELLLAGSHPLGQPCSRVGRLEACKHPRAACRAGRGATCVQAGPLELSRGTVCGGVSQKAAQPGSAGAEPALARLEGDTCRAREPCSPR